MNHVFNQSSPSQSTYDIGQLGTRLVIGSDTFLPILSAQSITKWQSGSSRNRPEPAHRGPTPQNISESLSDSSSRRLSGPEQKRAAVFCHYNTMLDNNTSRSGFVFANKIKRKGRGGGNESAGVIVSMVIILSFGVTACRTREREE